MRNVTFAEFRANLQVAPQVVNVSDNVSYYFTLMPDGSVILDNSVFDGQNRVVFEMFGTQRLTMSYALGIYNMLVGLSTVK